jgi:uncharacterized DUF497 family protein
VGYNFEWDPEKAEANLRKHDVSFGCGDTMWGQVSQSHIVVMQAPTP